MSRTDDLMDQLAESATQYLSDILKITGNAGFDLLKELGIGLAAHPERPHTETQKQLKRIQTLMEAALTALSGGKMEKAHEHRRVIQNVLTSYGLIAENRAIKAAWELWDKIVGLSIDAAKGVLPVVAGHIGAVISQVVPFIGEAADLVADAVDPATKSTIDDAQTAARLTDDESYVLVLKPKASPDDSDATKSADDPSGDPSDDDSSGGETPDDESGTGGDPDDPSGEGEGDETPEEPDEEKTGTDT